MLDGVLPQPLTPEEYLELASNPDKKFVQDTLIERNVRLAVYIANRYKKSLIDGDEDAIGVALVGLVEAARGFDFGRNIKFATYAHKCITSRLLSQLNREKKCPKAKTLYYYDAAYRSKEGEDIPFIEVIGGDDHNLELVLTKKVLKQAFNGWAKLNNKEKTVIFERFFNDKTQIDLKKILGKSQAQVSRIQKEALSKLRTCI